MTAVLAHKVRNLKRKRSTNLAYHLIQSFSPEDAVTPEQAPELGKKLAFEYTGGKYEYVVATHIDKGHKPSKTNSSVSGSGSRPSSSSSSTKHKYTCIKDGCTREADTDSAYCWVHRPSKSSTKSSTSYSSKSSYSSSYSSSKKSYKTYDSYDDGYDAIYDDDDYDEDRYDSDPDYAAGVDDAMDELDW